MVVMIEGSVSFGDKTAANGRSPAEARRGLGLLLVRLGRGDAGPSLAGSCPAARMSGRAAVADDRGASA